jgi:dienelactone hydrolase
MSRAGIVAAACAVVLVGHAVAAAKPRVEVLRFVDRARFAHYRTGAVVSRMLTTYVRYPTAGRPPYPLVVFGHGFAVTPGLYATLLDAWARAGFVVAAPLFPVENANAPGGPDESDLVNQPGDIRFVITRLLASARNKRSPLYHMIDPRHIGIAGQSDGGETAFAVAYERSFRDPRISACVVLSGARLPGEPLIAGHGHPPLLAVQGTADTINPPNLTEESFRQVARPKFLLLLLGAGHLPPYSTNTTQLAVVERTTIAFLDRYLRGDSLHRLATAATAPGVARFVAEP